MQLSNKQTSLLIGFIIGLLPCQASLACEDIAVLSRDARYIILSGGTLEKKTLAIFGGWAFGKSTVLFGTRLWNGWVFGPIGAPLLRRLSAY